MTILIHDPDVFAEKEEQTAFLDQGQPLEEVQFHMLK